MSVEEKASLVFIPLPVLSHLSAAVAAAKLISERDERLAVTVLLMKLPGPTKVSSLSPRPLPIHQNSPQSRVNFIHLPEMPSEYPNGDAFGHIASQKPAVTDAVAGIIKSQKLNRVPCFVIDMLCFSMTDVANDLGAPTYVFFTCSAAAVGFMVDLHKLRDYHDQDLTAYEASGDSISVSTFVNPVPARVWPASTFIKGTAFPDPFIDRFKVFRGIMVNTFLEFEHHSIRSVSENRKIPQIYPVGPILGGGMEEEEEEERDEILGWLDEQPDSSVVYISFGSLAFVEWDQVKEIALALEQSKQRFLWSLKKPPPKENANGVLPEGFLDRVKGTGMVIEWAPQKAVLAHPAVGGFVSHCGWNSILESIWFGVPIATFPLFAEQQLNAFQLVREFGMAEMIRIDYHKDAKTPEIVCAEEIEAAIRRLMTADGESGARQRVKEMQKKARSALEEGGSSFNATTQFIEDVVAWTT